MEKKLSPNDLGEIYEEIHEATTKWEKIGLGLKISPSTLDRIRTDYAGKSEDQLQEMLKEWLNRSPHPTRQELAIVLRSETVGLPRLAEELEDKHKKEAVTITEHDGQSSSGPQPSHTQPMMTAGGENSTNTRSRSEEPVRKKCKVARPEDNITFVNPVPEDLKCVQCGYVAIEPQQLQCGNLLCQYCSKNVSMCPMPECPDCGDDVNTVPDTKSKKAIKKLEVECNGCEWRGELKELDNHLSTCPQKLLCPYSSETDCRAKFPNRDLHNHLTACQEQHFRGALITIKKLKSTTTDLQTHVNKLSTELNEAMEAHKSMLTTIQELNSTTTNLQTQVYKLSTKLKEVEESQECCRPQTPPLILRIKEFDVIHLERFDSDGTISWYTPPFYTHNRGYKLKLCITEAVKAHECRKVTFSVEALPGRYDYELGNSKVEVIATLLHPKAGVPNYPLEIPRFSCSRRYESSTRRYYTAIDDIPETVLTVIQRTSVSKGKQRSICIKDYCTLDGIYIRVSDVKFSALSYSDPLHLLLPEYTRPEVY